MARRAYGDEGPRLQIRRLHKQEKILGTEVVINYLLPLVIVALVLLVSGFVAYDRLVVTPSTLKSIEELPPLRTHIVQRGETLWEIARIYYPDQKYSIIWLVEMLKDANEPIDPGKLKIGRELIIPRLELQEKEGGN